MIEYIAETGSTNADISARIAHGGFWPEGRWLVADRQTAGRGRLGRAWFDGRGNFMGSTAVRLLPHDPAPGSLALVAGLAVLETVSAVLPPPNRAQLKWPNDVLVAGAKLAGILLERVGDTVVVGIGVNLTSAPELPDRATIALSRFAPAPERDGFASQLAAHFASEVSRWRNYGLGPIVARWQAAGHPVGTPLSVLDGSGAALGGTFAGLAEDGALLMALADGTTRIIHAGEVNLV